MYFIVHHIACMYECMYVSILIGTIPMGQLLFYVISD